MTSGSRSFRSACSRVIRSATSCATIPSVPFVRRPVGGHNPGGTRRGQAETCRSNTGVVAQVFDAVDPLPGELRLVSAEVSVRSGLLVDRAAEVQVLDDSD